MFHEQLQYDSINTAGVKAHCKFDLGSVLIWLLKATFERVPQGIHRQR